MLFRRREPEPLAERLKVWLWPRRSWSRSIRYIKKRVWRLAGSPHAIALGFAIGVFVSFTPYLGLHFLIAGLLAWLLGGSIIASALGTFFGNPLTFPLIWGSTYKLGSFLLGYSHQAASVDLSEGLIHPSYDSVWAYIASIFSSLDQLWLVLKPMTIGALPLGFIVAFILYFPVRTAVAAYQVSRQKRIARRRSNLARHGRHTRRISKVSHPGKTTQAEFEAPPRFRVISEANT